MNKIDTTGKQDRHNEQTDRHNDETRSTISRSNVNIILGIYINQQSIEVGSPRTTHSSHDAVN